MTLIRYEFVGTGAGFHREARIGYWELEWEKAPSNDDCRVRSWKQRNETRSRCATPMYQDITKSAFDSCPSYRSQLIHGVDYWRTLLDAASGIDIYGHNGVSAGDLHGNGFDDLYICQPSGFPNRLFRSRGDGTFEDVTEKSGTGLLDNTACALIADFNNDGRQELLVVRAADGPLLFTNEGKGKFKPLPDAFHFANPPAGNLYGSGRR